MTTPSLMEDADNKTAAPGAHVLLQPRTIEETGLSFLFLVELACKILFLRGRISLLDLASHIKLPATILENILSFMRTEHLCELASRGDSAGSTFVQLSETGRARANDFLRRCQYAGPAPVSLDAYAAQIHRQSIRQVSYTREILTKGYTGIVMHNKVLDQLGAAMNSGRAIIIYGPAGSGKTFIVENLSNLLSDVVAIPYAILVDSEIIRMYDPHIHQLIPQATSIGGNLTRKADVDARWLVCKRPVVITGGELTMEALDLDFDDNTRYYQAPPHVKANNGLFVIDDLGRQKMAPQELMNRWIVPLDRGHDYLTLHTGYKFQIPFDVIVVFSSNQDPNKLADEAFLRRLGYKIHIGALNQDQYRTVFRQVCEKLSIPYSETAFEYLLEQHHFKEGRALLACYPRDLLGQVRDLSIYESQAAELSTNTLDWAWDNYFTPSQQLKIDKKAPSP